MQTLRAGCSKVEPKNFAPPQTPFPRDAGWQKFNQLEMVTTFTYSPSLVRIDARNFELSWQQTHAYIHPPTGPITIHCAAASAQFNKNLLHQQIQKLRGHIAHQSNGGHFAPQIIHNIIWLVCMNQAYHSHNISRCAPSRVGKNLSDAPSTAILLHPLSEFLNHQQR